VSKKSKKLLIDADLIVYRSCVAVEKDVRWNESMLDEGISASPNVHILYSDFSDAWPNVELAFTRLFERFDTDDHVAALTVGRNFRYDVDPTYKGNRADTRKPLCFHRVREELAKHYNVVSFDGIEADDILGIFATRDPNAIVWSLDKDLQGIPCTLYDGKTVRKIDRYKADEYFFYQVLVGDTADGYPGCPGVGPKKAEAILKAAQDERNKADVEFARYGDYWWRAVVKTYEKYGLTEADALKQARLARILRDSDWDSKNKKPILWTP
jgi:5'-3' exonuclease